jgi:hypothetical protein
VVSYRAWHRGLVSRSVAPTDTARLVAEAGGCPSDLAGRPVPVGDCVRSAGPSGRTRGASHKRILDPREILSGEPVEVGAAQRHGRDAGPAEVLGSGVHDVTSAVGRHAPPSLVDPSHRCRRYWRTDPGPRSRLRASPRRKTTTARFMMAAVHRGPCSWQMSSRIAKHRRRCHDDDGATGAKTAHRDSTSTPADAEIIHPGRPQPAEPDSAVAMYPRGE